MTKTYTVRQVKLSEFKGIRELIKSKREWQENAWIKRSWEKSIWDMAYDGLLSGKWVGLGYFDHDGTLMAYLDYKEHASSVIEIGICMTVDQYTNRGLMQALLKYVISSFSNREIIIGTSEQNKAMIACIEHVGFYEDFRVEQDRIDGSASIHYHFIPNLRQF